MYVIIGIDVQINAYSCKEKGRDLFLSYTNGKPKQAKWKYKHDTKMFDYTAIADRLKIVIWSSYMYSNPTVLRA